MLVLRALVMVLLSVVTAIGVAAGSPPTGGPSSQEKQRPPQFRAEVTNVLVDALVLDEKGQPVAGLTREDFEVYEDGVRQVINNLDVIDWTSYVAREAPRQGQPATSTAGAVNVFPRRFIFILNRQGARFGDLVRAKRALETFVVESMAEGDEAMIIDMGNANKIVQEFRPSKEETIRAVRKITPMTVDLYLGTEMATRQIYETLESLGQVLEVFPGRKIILFLSNELYRTRDLISYLEDTVDALNQSNTTVYSIDLRGADAPLVRGFDIGGLSPLASETGGRYFYNLTAYEPAIRRIGQENRRYYLLTYAPSNTKLDGKYRKIEVRVKRPKVQVVARRGYFARKAPEVVVTDAAEPAEADAVETEPQVPAPRPSPPPPRPARPEPTGPVAPVGVEITTYLFPTGEGQVNVPIAAALPLDLLSAGGKQISSRDLKLTITDSDGKIVQTFEEPVDPARFYVVRNARLAPGVYLLQLILESSGEEMYRASTPIEVPAGLESRFG
ncbi:MAG: VWA domain-containing protein, partial [Acidobacteriota bacterium]